MTRRRKKMEELTKDNFKLMMVMERSIFKGEPKMAKLIGTGDRVYFCKSQKDGHKKFKALEKENAKAAEFAAHKESQKTDSPKPLQKLSTAA